MKKWLKTPLGIAIIAQIIGTALLLARMTSRWDTHDKGGLALAKSGQPVIFVIWHGRLMGIIFMISYFKDVAYVISTSSDGQLISKVVGILKSKTISGSGSNNALSAFREMMRRLKSGKIVGITPDGPRGPARKAAEGAVKIAKASGAPLVPVAWSTNKMKRFKSWDSMAWPGLFSRGVFHFGAPIYIPRDADDKALEKMNIGLEDAVNALFHDADTRFGHTPDHANSRYGIAKKKR